MTDHQTTATAGSFDELASRMYPNMTQPAAAPAPVQPVQQAAAVAGEAPAREPGRTDAPPAERMYPGVEPLPPAEAAGDAELQALRDDAAHRMYSVPEAERAVRADMFDGIVGKTVAVDGQDVEFTHENARKAVSELRAMAADLALSETEMATVQDGLTFGQSIKGDADKISAARDSAVEMLNAEFGERAAFAAAAARTFVSKNPKLGTLLDRTGAGDSPQVIMRIARRAMALHGEGKLTVARKD